MAAHAGLAGRVFAQVSSWPTVVDPVNDTLRTRASANSSLAVTEPGAVTTFSTPGGMPASIASRPSSRG